MVNILYNYLKKKLSFMPDCTMAKEKKLLTLYIK